MLKCAECHHAVLAHYEFDGSNRCLVARCRCGAGAVLTFSQACSRLRLTKGELEGILSRESGMCDYEGAERLFNEAHLDRLRRHVERLDGLVAGAEE